MAFASQQRRERPAEDVRELFQEAEDETVASIAQTPLLSKWLSHVDDAGKRNTCSLRSIAFSRRRPVQIPLPSCRLQPAARTCSCRRRFGQTAAAR